MTAVFTLWSDAGVTTCWCTGEWPLCVYSPVLYVGGPVGVGGFVICFYVNEKMKNNENMS